MNSHGPRPGRPMSLIMAIAVMLMLPHAKAEESAAGQVANLSGPLSARSTDGKLRALAIESHVHEGDTLFSEQETYARIKFADGGEITLKPNSQMQIEKFNYKEKKVEESSAFFRLVRGGLRAITGLVGKVQKDGYRMNTPTATIGIRGTQFSLVFCQDDCGGIRTASGTPPENGLHIDVIDGAIVASNAGGSQQFSAGQAGIVRSLSLAPQLVPQEDAVKLPLSLGGMGVGSPNECSVQ